MTLWAATLLVSVPYLWVLGRGVGVLGRVLAVGAIVGTLLALGTACLALVISGRARSNRISLGASAFLLLALTAPTQLPTGARQGPLGDLVTRIGPIAGGSATSAGSSSAEHLDGRPFRSRLAGATVLVFGAVLLLAHERLLALAPRIEGR